MNFGVAIQRVQRTFSTNNTLRSLLEASFNIGSLVSSRLVVERNREEPVLKRKTKPSLERTAATQRARSVPVFPLNDGDTVDIQLGPKGNGWCRAFTTLFAVDGLANSKTL
jgi:hypothetical protein